MNSINKIRVLLDRNEKKRFLILFFMMIFAAILETLGIGLIGPFVTIVTNPEMVQQNRILFSIYNFFHFNSTNSFLIVMTIALLAAFVLKNLYLLFFYFIQFKIIYNAQVRMSRKLLTAYLTKPYVFHLSRNSADLVRNTNTEIKKLFDEIIVPAFVFATELMVIASLFTFLMFTSPTATILSGILLGGSVTLFMKKFRSKMSDMGVKQQKAQGGMIKWVNQSLGAAKEVKVTGRENFFIDSYERESINYADSMRFYTMMQQAPRLFIETVTVGTILAIVLVIMIQSNDLTELLATVAMFGMAAFRLMPSINRLVSSLAKIRTNIPALNIIYEDLKDVPDPQEMLEELKEKNNSGFSQTKSFNNGITVNHVSFHYPSAERDALSDINLTIPIGDSVAFVGESGSGKTTLTDIILGVLEPNEGTIKVDGRETKEIRKLWQKKIGYIPQSIYLSDDTVRRNVAFGLESNEINNEKVWAALEQAQMKEYVEQLPGQLDAFVGENGVRMSGGQRQRIGIARALYNNPEILFLDEATSALDNETEKEIMSAIYNLQGDKTLIIIAHRLSTIEDCDTIYRLSNGRVTEVTYKKAYRSPVRS